MHPMPIRQRPDRQATYPPVTANRLEQLHLGRPQRASSAGVPLIFPRRLWSGAKSSRHNPDPDQQVGPDQAATVGPTEPVTARPTTVTAGGSRPKLDRGW